MPKEVKNSTWLRELLGLCAFAAALMLVISLATYDPRDPAPFFKAGAAGPARNFIGPVGAFVAELLVPQLFGFAAVVLPIGLGLLGWKLFWCQPLRAPFTRVVGTVLLLGSLTGMLTLTLGTLTLRGEPVRAGGAIGELCAGALRSGVNPIGAFIILVTAVLVSVVLCTQFSFAVFVSSTSETVGSRLRSLRTAWVHYLEARRKEQMRREVIKKHAQKDTKEGDASLPRVRKTAKAAPEPEEDDELDVAGQSVISPPPLSFDDPDVDAGLSMPPAPRGTSAVAPATAPPAEPTVRARKAKKIVPPRPVAPGSFPLPPTNLLDEIANEGSVDKSRLFEKAKALQAKSGEFGVMGSVVEIHPGPVVTTYEFKPDAGVKYSKIVGLGNDLALALEAESIRIDRMSGRGTVAIEIPNEKREIISLREMIESERFQNAPGRLTMVLGKTVSGEPYITDLATMPHLLIAGSTGTGKSVGLNCIITSLLYKARPDECRLILIDPKRLELSVYEEIPHLLTPVVTDPKIASNVLKWAVTEMERRIRILASEGVRNIEQFNNIVRSEKATGEDLQPLNYIVIIIDELADLMMVSSNDVEESITRLAQMARAVGIHLILATQRPSVDVLTGLIKANFPSRISFRVAARVDSRTILDSIGAEQLLGKGDMLFLPPGSSRLMRIHGAYVGEKEVARLTEYLREAGKPTYDESVGKQERAAEAGEVLEKDDLYDDCVKFVIDSGQASTSALQRRFRIGFSRAGRLIDIMEREGIIGPPDGSKPREVLAARDRYEAVDQ
jgi:S-DNA-T family DNA segregation ATPase FtsK/SpoIIIE